MRTQTVCLALAIVLMCPLASAQWVPANGPYGGRISRLAGYGSNLFAGTSRGMYILNDDGTSWTPVNTPFLDFSQVVGLGPTLYAGSDRGVYRSTDDGTNWIRVSEGLSDTSVTALAVCGRSLFAGTRSKGVFLSTNEGQIWTQVNTGLTDTNVVSLGVDGSTVFVASRRGFFLSTNSGASWSAGAPAGGHVLALTVCGPILFIKYDGGWGGLPATFRSSDHGKSWQPLNLLGLSQVVRLGPALYAAGYDGVYRSTDDGTNWIRVSGFPGDDFTALAVLDTNLFAATQHSGVYRSSNCGTSWVEVSTGLTGTEIQTLAISGASLFAGTWGGRVFRSTDNGTSWTGADSGLTTTNVLVLAVSGKSLLAGTVDGIFRSTDNGAIWMPVNSGLSNPRVQVGSLVVKNSCLFAGTNDGVFASTNNGASWSKLYDRHINKLAFSGSKLFAGTNGAGVFLSTDDGKIWTDVSTGLTDGYVFDLAVLGTHVFVSTFDGIFHSTNDGTNWKSINSGLTDTPAHALTVSGTNLYAGTRGGVFISTDNGNNWCAVSSGLTSRFVNCILVNGPIIFGGTYGGGVWRRPLSEMITSMTLPSSQIPAASLLHQNYPNPFNPSTTIKYELPTSSVVRMTVCDMLGREVSVLVNERRDAGVHEVKFEAPGLSSGVYFYRLQAGDFTQTKRLLLLR